MPCKGVRDAFYRGIGGIPYCRTKHPLHSCKVSERQKPGRPPQPLKALIFLKTSHDFRPIPHIIFWKAFVQRGKRMWGMFFIPHKSLTYLSHHPSHHAYAARSGYAYERQADRRVDVSVNVRGKWRIMWGMMWGMNLSKPLYIKDSCSKMWGMG